MFETYRHATEGRADLLSDSDTGNAAVVTWFASLTVDGPPAGEITGAGQAGNPAREQPELDVSPIAEEDEDKEWVSVARRASYRWMDDNPY